MWPAASGGRLGDPGKHLLDGAWGIQLLTPGLSLMGLLNAISARGSPAASRPLWGTDSSGERSLIECRWFCSLGVTRSCTVEVPPTSPRTPFRDHQGPKSESANRQGWICKRCGVSQDRNVLLSRTVSLRRDHDSRRSGSSKWVRARPLGLLLVYQEAQSVVRVESYH
jgi:hypothetical protein